MAVVREDFDRTNSNLKDQLEQATEKARRNKVKAKEYKSELEKKSQRVTDLEKAQRDGEKRLARAEQKHQAALKDAKMSRETAEMKLNAKIELLEE